MVRGTRYDQARKVQRRFAARERDEWRRVAAREFQGRPLNSWEREILKAGPPSQKVGAPSTLASPQLVLARHYWLNKHHKALTRDPAEAEIAKAWGRSTGAVRKYAIAHKAAAEEWLREALKDPHVVPGALLETLALAAACFAKAAKK